MTTALVAFVVAFLVGAVVTYLMRQIAPMIGAVDEPDGFRKIHTHAIPYLGGIGVFVGFMAPILLLLFVFTHLNTARLLWDANGPFFMILAGALIALVMGAWDDIRGMRPAHKFALQSVAALVAMAGGNVIWRLSLPCLPDISLGFWGVPLTLFWFLGCMNAINLLDGMDGLAGGISLIVCITMLLVGHYMGNVIGMILMACLGGGILGFLVHNFHPARIFLGDSGSNVIGFLIAALALMTSRKSETAVALLVPVLALGVPIIDTSLAIVRRWSHWLPFSAPDRQHIHHLLLRLGLSQRRAVLIMYGASIVLCGAALLSIAEEREMLLLLFGSLGVLVFVCIRVLGAIQLDDLRNRFTRDWRRRETANLARIEMEKYAHRVNLFSDLDAVWAESWSTLKLMGVDYAKLAVEGEDETPTEWEWTSRDCPPDIAATPNHWQVQLQLPIDGKVVGDLHMAGQTADGRIFVLDRADMIWRFRDLMAGQLQRLLAPDAVPVEEAGSAQPPAEKAESAQPPAETSVSMVAQR